MSAPKAQKTAKAQTSYTIGSMASAGQAKYCSQCGKPVGQCQCQCCEQTTTICISFNTSVLQNLVNLLPKVQITTNRCCTECGHPAHTGECPEPDCDCE